MYDDVLLLLRQSTQSTPDNSKLQGNSKKGGVIGSSMQVIENEKIRKWDGIGKEYKYDAHLELRKQNFN